MIEELRLIELITLQRGYDISKKDQNEGTVPVISSGGVLSYHDKYKVKGPGVVIGRKGTLGSVFYTDENYWPHSTGLWVKEFNNNNPKFIYYFLKTLHLERFDSGAANPTLNRNHIHSLNVKVPQKKYRNKIASILSAYDDLIESNNQRIQLLEEMAEEIYKEWFVRFRFPGYQNTKFLNEKGKEAPHGTKGAIPEGWKKLKFRDCLKHYIGGGWGEDIPKGKSSIPAYVVRGTDFPDFNVGRMNFDVLRFHTESNLSSRRCEPNDIIFEVSGGTESQSLGRTCFMSKKAIERFDEPVICASFCKLLRIDKNIVSPFFISELLKRMHKTGELKVFQVQSTGLSNYQFEDFIDFTKILNPSNDVQHQFELLIKPIYEETQLIGEKNHVLQETRDLLLPRLMSGKLSVDHLKLKEQELAMAAEPK